MLKKAKANDEASKAKQEAIERITNETKPAALTKEQLNEIVDKINSLPNDEELNKKIVTIENLVSLQRQINEAETLNNNLFVNDENNPNTAIQEALKEAKELLSKEKYEEIIAGTEKLAEALAQAQANSAKNKQAKIDALNLNNLPADVASKIKESLNKETNVTNFESKITNANDLNDLTKWFKDLDEKKNDFVLTEQTKTSFDDLVSNNYQNLFTDAKFETAEDFSNLVNDLKAKQTKEYNDIVVLANAELDKLESGLSQEEIQSYKNKIAEVKNSDAFKVNEILKEAQAKSKENNQQKTSESLKDKLSKVIASESNIYLAEETKKQINDFLENFEQNTTNKSEAELEKLISDANELFNNSKSEIITNAKDAISKLEVTDELKTKGNSDLDKLINENSKELDFLEAKSVVQQISEFVKPIEDANKVISDKDTVTTSQDYQFADSNLKEAYNQAIKDLETLKKDLSNVSVTALTEALKKVAKAKEDLNGASNLTETKDKIAQLTKLDSKLVEQEKANLANLADKAALEEKFKELQTANASASELLGKYNELNTLLDGKELSEYLKGDELTAAETKLSEVLQTLNNSKDKVNTTVNADIQDAINKLKELIKTVEDNKPKRTPEEQATYEEILKARDKAKELLAKDVANLLTPEAKAKLEELANNAEANSIGKNNDELQAILKELVDETANVQNQIVAQAKADINAKEIPTKLKDQLLEKAGQATFDNLDDLNGLINTATTTEPLYKEHQNNLADAIKAQTDNNFIYADPNLQKDYLAALEKYNDAIKNWNQDLKAEKLNELKGAVEQAQNKLNGVANFNATKEQIDALKLTAKPAKEKLLEQLNNAKNKADLETIQNQINNLDKLDQDLLDANKHFLLATNDPLIVAKLPQAIQEELNALKQEAKSMIENDLVNSTNSQVIEDLINRLNSVTNKIQNHASGILDKVKELIKQQTEFADPRLTDLIGSEQQSKINDNLKNLPQNLEDLSAAKLEELANNLAKENQELDKYLTGKIAAEIEKLPLDKQSKADFINKVQNDKVTPLDDFNIYEQAKALAKLEQDSYLATKDFRDNLIKDQNYQYADREKKANLDQAYGKLKEYLNNPTIKDFAKLNDLYQQFQQAKQELNGTENYNNVKAAIESMDNISQAQKDALQDKLDSLSHQSGESANEIKNHADQLDKISTELLEKYNKINDLLNDPKIKNSIHPKDLNNIINALDETNDLFVSDNNQKLNSRDIHTLTNLKNKLNTYYSFLTLKPYKPFIQWYWLGLGVTGLLTSITSIWLILVGKRKKDKDDETK
ncbi:hypothetical protein [Mycoplasma hafezii]|uniref:hypothetical protein n=1 Tax=Mycoplasma hafezii TaxID=525886 RepID=UPI003CF66FD6